MVQEDDAAARPHDPAQALVGARLRALAAGDPRIRFRGPVAPDGQGRLWDSLDALVVPSLWWENSPLAVLEALAAGTPVVSTPVSGMRGLLGGGAGVVVDDFTPEALAAAIRELLHDPARRAAMGAAGAALVRERYSLEAMVAAYEGRYVALAPTIPHR